MFLDQIDKEYFKKTGEIRANEEYLKTLSNYTEVINSGGVLNFISIKKKLTFWEYLAQNVRDYPNKFNKLISKLSNFEIKDLELIWGEITFQIADFITGDSKTIALWMLIVCLHLNSGYLMFSKLLSHEKSKKLYFVLYLISITYIIVNCLFLINLPIKDKAEEGIVFLYIYASATLMLFLIFLALTTCESYLYKERDLIGVDKEVELIKLIINNTLIAIPVFFYYLGIIKECNCNYYFKLGIFTKETKSFGFENGESKFYWEREREYLEFKKKIFYGEPINTKKNPIGIFDKLRRAIMDSGYEYILSALLQMLTLILIIITSII